MKIPSKQEVLEHFKNAKTIRCFVDKLEHEYDPYIRNGLHIWAGDWWMDSENNSHQIWNENEGYTEIIETNQETKTNYKVGDIVNMVGAGGWGFNPKNNGCLAIITEVGERYTDDENKVAIDGYLLNYNIDSSTTFRNIPESGHGRVSFRLATQSEIQEANLKLKGYKLIKPEYTYAALRIEGHLSIGEAIRNGEQLVVKEEAIDKFITAGVLDLWFQPVYETTPIKPTLPKINGYEGIDKDDHLKYGCAEIPKIFFSTDFNRHIKSMRLSSGAQISEEEMNQIREYLQQ